MDWVQITLLILTILVVLLILIGFFASRSLTKFERQMSKKMHAINVLMAQKQDLLVIMAKLFKKYHVLLPKEFVDDLTPVLDENLKSLTFTERLTIKTYLMKTSQSIIYYAEQSQSIREDHEYQVLKRALVELDDNHRRLSAIYNADVLGFNYWIKVWYLRPVCRLMKFKEKELLS